MPSSLACPRTSRPLGIAVAIHPIAGGFRPAAAVLAIALAFALQPRCVGAQPVPAQVVHGSASFARDGSNLLVTTGNGAGTNHSAINWTSFSVPAGSITQFVQPSAASTSINRVVEANPSQIFGRLASNGRLVLVNPWGIAIGAGAQVDTAGFTASTLGMREADAIAGRLRFAGGAAALKLDGTIRAQGGDVVLIAPKLETGAAAVVQADGAAVLAAGQEVEITGRGLEGILMRVQAGSEAVNLGTLQGDAVGIFAGTLRHSGLVQAQAVRVAGGKVVLQAAGDALVDGTIVARQADRGGSVDVFGERVGLLAGARLDASGAAGGGSVRIGGDYQGGNGTVPNAQKTYVDAQATIAADATQQGDGGRVIVWSDDMTRMRGRISARGGAQGGDGGFAEVSGKRFLDFTGRVDLRAPAGQAGKLLLDPNDIEISGSHATDTSSTGSVFEGGGDTAYVAAQDLSDQLALGDVQVKTSGGTSSTASGHLTLAADANVQWTSGRALTLSADHGISLAGQVNATNTGGGSGSLYLSAANGSIVQTAGSLRVGMLVAAAPDGDVLLDQPNHVEVLAGYSADAGSQFVFRNAETLNILSMGPDMVGVNSASPKLGATTIRTDAGDLYAHAPIGGGSVTLQAADTFDMMADTTITARTGKLSVHAGGALMLAMQPGASTYSVATLRGATGVELVSDGTIRSSSSWPAYGDVGPSTAAVHVYAEGGSGVTVTANGGDVDFGPSSFIYSWHAPVLVTSVPGSILGNAQIYTWGTANGSITLDAAQGSVNFRALNSSGSYSSPRAGAVTVTAKGDVHGSSIAAQGAPSDSAEPGDGGAVSVSSSEGNIALDQVGTEGGLGATGGGQGGQGGTITLTAPGTAEAGGSITVTGNLAAKGGTTEGATMLAGGAGGAVTVQARRAVALGTVDLQGGANSTSAGHDGLGGTLVVAGGSVSTGEINTSGLSGGNVTISSEGGNLAIAGITANGRWASGGVGGNGGNVSLTALSGGEAGGIINVGSTGILAYGSGGASGAGLGGSVTVQASRGIEVVGQISAYTSTYGADSAGGLGGTVLLDALAGDVRAGNVYAYGAQGGSFTVNAHQGNIFLAGADTSSGSYSAGVFKGGPITLEAPGTGASGGNISVSGWLHSRGSHSTGPVSGEGGAIALHADKTIAVSGGITAPGGYSESTGGKGGSIDVTSDNGGIVIASLSAVGGYGSAVSGGAGGTIHLKALGIGESGGTIQAGGESGINVEGGSSWTGAGGDGGSVTAEASTYVLISSIDVAGASSSNGDAAAAGGSGGTVTLFAKHGIVQVGGSIDLAGGAGANGGPLRHGHGGTLDVSSGGFVSLAEVNADGGSGRNAGEAGGDAGTVLVSALADIQLGDSAWTANGGQGQDAAGGAGATVTLTSSQGSVTMPRALYAFGGTGAPGGKGGSITIDAAVDVAVPAVFATGGAGSASQGGAQGGDGGSVSLRFGGGTAAEHIGVDGGAGASGTLERPDGGKGGQGGSIEIAFLGTHAVTGEGVTLTARGGDGGSAYWGSTGIGAVGGDGGSIGASSAAGLRLRVNPETLAHNVVDAGPGAGGWNADESAQAARGAAGFAAISAAGDLAIEDLYYHPATHLSAVAGGALTLDIPIVTQGGTVSLQGASMTLTQPIDTTGGPPLRLFAAPTLSAAATTPPGADVTITADQLDLQTTVNAGSARATVRPLTSTRATRLGGADDPATLQLSQDEINRITAGTLQVGDALNTGGVSIAGAIAIDPALAPVLALVSQGAIAQDAGSTLAALNLSASGGSVMLDDVTVSTVSGSAAAGAFQLASHGSGTLAIGTVDTTSGITAAGPVAITSAGPLQLLDAIGSGASGDAVVLAAPQLQAASTAGIATPAGRWLVYLDTLGGNDFGPLRSGNHALWGRNFAANPPASITQAGNRFLFGQRPALDVAADARTKVYDGTPGFTLSFQASGFVDPALYQNAFLQDDAGVFTGALALANPGKNVGSYAITQGTLASDYTIRSFTGNTATITKAPLAVNGLFAGKVYDATTQATIGAGASLVGLVTGDDVVFTGAAGRFDTKNVGTGKVVTVTSAALSGADLGNYAVTLAPASGTITPAPLTVSGVTTRKVYDATTGAVLGTVATLGGLFAGDVVVFSGGTGVYDNKNVGTGKLVTVTSAALSGADLGNYTVTLAPASGTITPAPLTVGGVTTRKVYDATTSAVLGTEATLGGLFAGDVVVFSGGTGVYDDKNVGIGKLVTVTSAALSGADLGNYAVTLAPASGTITPATLRLAGGVTAQDKRYDASDTATLAGTPVLAGLASTSDVVQATPGSARFDNKNVGSNKPVTVTGWTLSGADAGNYVLAADPLGLAASITPAPLTLSGVGIASKVYDGSTVATATGGTLAGVLGSDSVAFGAGSVVFADPNAGEAKPVSASGWTLSGPDAGNYTLAAPAVLAGTITPAPLTINANNLNKEEGKTLVFAGTEFTPAKTGVGDETITFVSLTSAGAAADAKAGAYAIKASGATGSNGFLAGNYAISYLDGALAVVPGFIAEAVPATVQVNNQVVTFATLFVQEAISQASAPVTDQDYKDAKKKKDEGQDDIIVTNNTCKPQ